ncbi:MAG: hypothetical protein K9G39_06355 [Chlorobium sp.]|uniref:hypothetical protein n=1 Tax=Chlorobium sp. TaxID=1095 RepID=UPI0025BA1D19|nr:hypothetical protein [Chlorobium sp.]MCF8383205.1 hypothetical protein [Chlorobium sp.]
MAKRKKPPVLRRGLSVQAEERSSGDRFGVCRSCKLQIGSASFCKKFLNYNSSLSESSERNKAAEKRFFCQKLRFIETVGKWPAVHGLQVLFLLFDEKNTVFVGQLSPAAYGGFIKGFKDCFQAA